MPQHSIFSYAPCFRGKKGCWPAAKVRVSALLFCAVWVFGAETLCAQGNISQSLSLGNTQPASQSWGNFDSSSHQRVISRSESEREIFSSGIDLQIEQASLTQESFLGTSSQSSHPLGQNDVSDSDVADNSGNIPAILKEQQEVATEEIGQGAEGRRTLLPKRKSEEVTATKKIGSRNMFVSTAGSLVFVLALFLGFAWFMRKNQPISEKKIPTEVVEVLGKIPFTKEHHLQLISVGKKLVLLSVTQHGIEPVCEVSEPQEVQRLKGLCYGSDKNGSTTSFRQLLSDAAKEPAGPGFLGKV
ncbi:MAG: flagellar biosynthetic protein FliO [Pirellulaceae bacterium]|nr:flagellar biosynthetic protein FliO [Pirellulaceae bacterium]